MKPTTDKTEHPLLVAASMARAYRSGEKTQTRRQVKPQPPSECSIHYMLGSESWLPPEKQTPLQHYWEAWHGELYKNRPKNHLCGGHTVICPYGKAGDKLWLRETYAVDEFDDGRRIVWAADMSAAYENNLSDVFYLPSSRNCIARCTPSIHMPRKYCQTVLNISAINVQRLQDITDEDALAEGVKEFFKTRKMHHTDRPKYLFQLLWTALYGPDAWDVNPYVWVITTDKVVAK